MVCTIREGQHSLVCVRVCTLCVWVADDTWRRPINSSILFTAPPAMLAGRPRSVAAAAVAWPRSAAAAAVTILALVVAPRLCLLSLVGVLSVLWFCWDRAEEAARLWIVHCLPGWLGVSHIRLEFFTLRSTRFELRGLEIGNAPGEWSAPYALRIARLAFTTGGVPGWLSLLGLKRLVNGSFVVGFRTRDLETFELHECRLFLEDRRPDGGLASSPGGKSKPAALPPKANAQNSTGSSRGGSTGGASTAGGADHRTPPGQTWWRRRHQPGRVPW